MFKIVIFKKLFERNLYGIFIYFLANEDDDVINTALINAMNQMESSSKQHRTSTDHNSNKFNDDDALKKHKSHVLAKYSQVSDEELDYEDEHQSSGNSLFKIPILKISKIVKKKDEKPNKKYER